MEEEKEEVFEWESNTRADEEEAFEWQSNTQEKEEA